eukprot:3815752-Alexandrium_andersonii.AAC.1
MESLPDSGKQVPVLTTQTCPILEVDRPYQDPATQNPVPVTHCGSAGDNMLGLHVRNTAEACLPASCNNDTC